MPAITSRVLVAIAGVLLGLGGFILATQALTLALTNQFGSPGGLVAAAVVLSALAALAFWSVSRPSQEIAAEAQEVKAAATDMISGLPGDAVIALVRKHPIAASLAAATVGYTLIRDPGRAVRQAQSILLRLL